MTLPKILALIALLLVILSIAVSGHAAWFIATAVGLLAVAILVSPPIP